MNESRLIEANIKLLDENTKLKYDVMILEKRIEAVKKRIKAIPNIEIYSTELFQILDGEIND